MRAPLAVVATVAVAVVITALVEGQEPPQPVAAGAPRFIDGDTFELGGATIRLHGIDAPEVRQTCGTWACGAAATAALIEIVANRPVSCEQTDIDRRYKRIVARCYVDGADDIGARMVRGGWALAYREYSREYVGLENLARQERAGIWQGDFITPAGWRQGLR